MRHFLLRALSSGPSSRTRAAGKTHIAVGFFDEVRNHLLLKLFKLLQKISSANSEGSVEMLGAHFGSPDDVLHSLQIPRLLQMFAGYSVILISIMTIRYNSKRDSFLKKNLIFSILINYITGIRTTTFRLWQPPARLTRCVLFPLIVCHEIFQIATFHCSLLFVSALFHLF